MPSWLSSLSDTHTSPSRRLVEEIQVSAGATDALTRVLYLTNMQAQLFKAETVPKMMPAFEARAPGTRAW